MAGGWFMRTCRFRGRWSRSAHRCPGRVLRWSACSVREKKNYIFTVEISRGSCVETDVLSSSSFLSALHSKNKLVCSDIGRDMFLLSICKPTLLHRTNRRSWVSPVLFVPSIHLNLLQMQTSSLFMLCSDFNHTSNITPDGCIQKWCSRGTYSVLIWSVRPLTKLPCLMTSEREQTVHNKIGFYCLFLIIENHLCQITHTHAHTHFLTNMFTASPASPLKSHFQSSNNLLIITALIGYHIICSPRTARRFKRKAHISARWITLS